MTVGELRLKLEAIGNDDLEVYYSDGEEGRMDGKLPVETLVVQTWDIEFLYQEWDGEETPFTGGWRPVVSIGEVKGVVLG